MVFGVEQIGQFFAGVNNFFIGTGVVVQVAIAFLMYIILNVVFIFLYFKFITTLPNLINQIKYLIRRVDMWLD